VYKLLLSCTVDDFPQGNWSVDVDVLPFNPA